MAEHARRRRVSLGARDLEQRYRAQSPPVSTGLTHQFAQGALTVVTGASGSGKSTLMYVLGLMLTPTTGTVLWEGTAVSGLPDGQRAALRGAHVGFVFQDAVLDLSRTALDNIGEAGWLAGLDRGESDRHGRELLDRFGVGHRAEHRPGEISGGQAQRIALCRALVKKPALLLADEPTGNLDSVSADIVWDALADEAAQGATVVVATHDTSRLSRADAQIRLGDE